MKLVGLTGRIGCGKSTAAKYLVEKYGFEHLSFVDKIFSKELRAQGLDVNRTNLQRIGKELYLKHGDVALTDTLLQDLAREGRYVIDDIRYPTTATYIRERYPREFYLIAIVASQELRYQRILSRSTLEQNVSWNDFIALDGAFTEVRIKDVEQLANYIVNNESGAQELHYQLDQVMQVILRNC